MISVDEARKMAMSFPGTVELPHFDRTSFRAGGKKIFMTMKEDEQFAVLMLTPEEQSLFSSSPDGSIYPVPNKWGLHGATIVNLKKVKKGLFKDAVTCAWNGKKPIAGSRKK